MEDWFTPFGWLLSVVTAVGNGIVVLLVAKNRRLHSSANWFVLSLAVADFGVGIVVFPLSYVCNKSLSCNGRVHMAAFWFIIHSSVTNLCILTWNRYSAIVHPLKYVTSTTARRPGRVILLAWLIPLMISLSLVLGMHATSSQTAWKVLRLIGVSGFDIVCCILLVYAVVRILVVARKQSLQDSAMVSIKRDLELQSQENQPSTQIAPPHGSKKKNTARFIIAIVTFFLGCQVVINYLFLRIMFSSHVSNDVGLVVIILLVANSAVNPLVYAFLKRDIKREIARAICSKKRRNKENERPRSRLTEIVQG